MDIKYNSDGLIPAIIQDANYENRFNARLHECRSGRKNFGNKEGDLF